LIPRPIIDPEIPLIPVTMKHLLLVTALTVFVSIPAPEHEAAATRPSSLIHTFSIVARDVQTGDVGVAVQSHWFCVRCSVTWAEAGVGVVSTQSLLEPADGRDNLEIRPIEGAPADGVVYIGESFPVQANMMLNDMAWLAMARAFRETKGELVDRMLAALGAGQAVGGDARCRQSAALIIGKTKSCS
jgi:uncharacterized Ntn-hydrolase superfamily protein